MVSTKKAAITRIHPYPDSKVIRHVMKNGAKSRFIATHVILIVSMYENAACFQKANWTLDYTMIQILIVLEIRRRDL